MRCVPVAYLLGAFWAVLSGSADFEINNLRDSNVGLKFDSPRLQFFLLVSWHAEVIPASDGMSGESSGVT